MADKTLFDLPSSPQQYGVALTPTSLRKIDYSGLDFDTSRKAIYEYIQTYFPDQFNDFVASNGIVMLVEIVSSIVGKLSLRADLLANEAFLPTATTEEAVVNHLALINQKIRNATPATTDIEVSIQNVSYTDIRLPAGIKLNTAAANNTVLTYEIYKSPNDYVSDIVIPAGKRGVIAFGIEGETVTSPDSLSPGGSSQSINISGDNILESPITVSVSYGSSKQNFTVIFEPIERYGPNDLVVEATILSTGITLRFGDDVTGKAPKVGSIISVTYRVGGGIRGRIGSFVIDTSRQYKPLSPATVPVSVRFRNITASSGGTDRESKEDAKKRAPKDYALQKSIVTSGDYAQAAKSFSHPAFGTVGKALATVRTGYNANIVDLYVLMQDLSAPNQGIRNALQTYVNQLNVATDTVEVLSGYQKRVDLKINVILHRNAEASVVKEKVEAAITAFFDLNNWEMGQSLYTSLLVDSTQAIDGILYTDLISPSSNILVADGVATSDGSNKPSDPTPYQVFKNQIIVLGDRSISYYYEKTT